VTLRVVAAGLAVAAAVLFLGVARPSRARALALGDDFRVAREERRQKRELLLERERREATVRQALAVVAAAPRPTGETVRQVRRTVVEALDNAQLGGVRLSVRPGHASGGAVVRVFGSGSVANVLGLTTALAQPGRGVVLGTVRFVRGRDGLGVELEALGFAVATRP
jgi:hypothetical protein